MACFLDITQFPQGASSSLLKEVLQTKENENYKVGKRVGRKEPGCYV